MSGDFSYIDGIDISSGLTSHMNLLIGNQKGACRGVDKLVLATYKDFKGGIINHLILKISSKGEGYYYLRVYKEKFKGELKFTDFIIGDKLPYEDDLKRILVEGKVN